MSLLRKFEGSSEDHSSQQPKPSESVEFRIKRGSSSRLDPYEDVKNRVQQRLIAELKPNMDYVQTAELRLTIQEIFESILAETNIVLTKSEKRRLFEWIVADILGYGILEPLLALDGVAEIRVNGPKNVFIERGGRIQRVNVTFNDSDHLRNVINRILSSSHQNFDQTLRAIETRLGDGSRVKIVMPPLSSEINLTIQMRSQLNIENLVGFGTITPEVVEFLKALIIAEFRIIISGLANSGKTTLLETLSQFIPTGERIVTIEHVAELRLRQEHVVTLEPYTAVDNNSSIFFQDLVTFSQHMRPDRLILGELRAGLYSALTLAANTCRNVMATMPAESPRSAIDLLTQWALDENPNLPLALIRSQLADSIDFIVHIERLQDGTRKVVNILEIEGIEGNVINMTEIFRFEQVEVQNGRVLGRLRPLGIRPKSVWKLQKMGIMLPPSIFGIVSRRRKSDQT